MKYLLFILICSLLVACFSTKVVTESASESLLILDKAVVKFPGYTKEMFVSGKNLFESNCQSCHGLKDPLKYTEEQWEILVPSMSAKANRNKDANLSKEDEELILKYVVSLGL